MPVIAVAGMVGGASALAAGGLTAFGTIAAIGSIVGGIGVLTGNKTLAAIGGIAGLAGGVGAFAQSQGWIASGSAGSALSDTANNTAAMADTASPLVENVTPQVADGSTAIADSGTAAIGQSAEQASGVTQGLQEATNNIAQASPLADSSSGLMNASASGPVPTSAGPALSKPMLDGTNAFGANSVPGAAAATAQSTSVFDTLKGFASSIYRNPDGTMNKDMLSMTGNFLGGMFDSEKEAKTDYYNAMAETAQSQLANGSAVPSLNLGLNGQHVTFNKKPQTYRAPRVSLMNAR